MHWVGERLVIKEVFKEIIVKEVEACTRSKTKEFSINNPNTFTIDQSTPLLSFDAFDDNWTNTGDHAYHPQPPLPVLTHKEGGGWYHRLFCGYNHDDILSYAASLLDDCFNTLCWFDDWSEYNHGNILCCVININDCSDTLWYGVFRFVLGVPGEFCKQVDGWGPPPVWNVSGIILGGFCKQVYGCLTSTSVLWSLWRSQKDSANQIRVVSPYCFGPHATLWTVSFIVMFLSFDCHPPRLDESKKELKASRWKILALTSHLDSAGISKTDADNLTQ